MAWFKYLKERGYFNPENNPSPIKDERGIQIPFWASLSYLEKLSIEIAKGKNIEEIKAILEIIKNVSESPKDNYRTWYVFMRILGNIPNESIPEDIFQFIPVWLTGMLDTTVQTSELCGKLLPKFLPENPTPADIRKAEIILKHIFAIEKEEGNAYSTTLRLKRYHFATVFSRPELLRKIVKYCSDDIVYLIAANTKKLLRDYPEGLNIRIKNGEHEYPVKVMIVDDDISINGTIVTNYEEFSEADLKSKLVKVILSQGIPYTETKENTDALGMISYSLRNDMHSALNFNSIDSLNGRLVENEHVAIVFACIFRDMLNEKAQIDPTGTIEMLRSILKNRKFQLAYFKKVILYVISQHWEGLKPLFWEMVGENDKLFVFSAYQTRKELYELLTKNQAAFTKPELEILKQVIEQGEQDVKPYDIADTVEHWKYRWFAALSKTEPFKTKYEALRPKFGRAASDFENEGKFITLRNSPPPLSKEELLAMPNTEIAAFLHLFRQKSDWEGPTYDALAGSFGKVVEDEPEKFIDGIVAYTELYYLYAYYMLNGFTEAWKNKKEFDWEKLLNFSTQYISDTRFSSGGFALEGDDSRVTYGWVLGALGELLSTGTYNDEHAFDKSLMDIAKALVLQMTGYLQTIKDFEKSGQHYPTYSLNSAAGKVLRALLDYALRRARVLNLSGDSIKWEEDIKAALEKTFEKGIIDGYILAGLYFQQFYFLDPEWITAQVKSYYDLDDTRWQAFFGGLMFGNSVFNMETYQLMYPHYSRGLANPVDTKAGYGTGIENHLFAFYVLGYEKLEDDGLLFKFLKQDKQDAVSGVMHVAVQYTNYFKSLSGSEKENFEGKVLFLWKFLAAMYHNPDTPEDKKTLAGLASLLVFVSQLNPEITALLLKSAPHMAGHYFEDRLIDDLSTLKDNGNIRENAKYIAQILSSLDFTQYFPGSEPEEISELLKFIIMHGEREAGGIICNKLTMMGHQFSREIYNKFLN